MTNDEGRKDKGQRTKDKGQRTKDKGRNTVYFIILVSPQAASIRANRCIP